MRFGILYNSSKDPGQKCASAVKNSILRRDQELVFYTDLIGLKESRDDIECDFLYVLGGDGTILAASRTFAEKNVGIVSINLGHLGYLSELDMVDIDSSVESILAGDYFIDNRVMLSCSKEGDDFVFTALNDFVLSHASVSRIVDIEISINGQPIDHYLCDGMIVCTPTGSTAYSLSAGGPVIAPDASCLLITPICPHTLSSKSIVINDHDEVGLRLKSDINKAVVSGDGVECFGISKDEVCIIKKSDLFARFIRFQERNFFDILKFKLNSNLETDRYYEN